MDAGQTAWEDFSGFGEFRGEIVLRREKKTRSDYFQRNLKCFSQNYGFTYVYLVRKNGKMYDRVVPWTKLSIFRVVDDIIWNFSDFTTNSYDFIFITDAPELTDKCCNVY